MDRKAYGALIGVLGFLVILIGSSMLMGALKASPPITGFVVLLGLALLVTGCGMFGYGWAGSPNLGLSRNAKWSLILTLLATVAIAVVA